MHAAHAFVRTAVLLRVPTEAFPGYATWKSRSSGRANIAAIVLRS